jgi:hypothetical protein
VSPRQHELIGHLGDGDFVHELASPGADGTRAPRCLGVIDKRPREAGVDREVPHKVLSGGLRGFQHYSEGSSVSMHPPKRCCESFRVVGGMALSNGLGNDQLTHVDVLSGEHIVHHRPYAEAAANAIEFAPTRGLGLAPLPPLTSRMVPRPTERIPVNA